MILSVQTASLGDSNINLYLETLLGFLVRVSCGGQGMVLHVGIVWCTTDWNKG